jgi:hypothetical protein
MAASTRIKATNIKFKIGTTEYSCDADNIELALSDAPGGQQTFCEVQPLQEWKLSIAGIASGDSTSLYQLLFANYATEVAFSIAPQGQHHCNHQRANLQRNCNLRHLATSLDDLGRHHGIRS